MGNNLALDRVFAVYISFSLQNPGHPGPSDVMHRAFCPLYLLERTTRRTLRHETGLSGTSEEGPGDPVVTLKYQCLQSR